MSVTRGDAFLGGGAQPPLVALGEHWICHHCNGVGIGIGIGIDIGIGITVGIGCALNLPSLYWFWYWCSY